MQRSIPTTEPPAAIPFGGPESANSSPVLPRPGERPILSPDPWPGFSIGLSNCRPTSRGEIMIRSADPSEHPKIVANAFSTNHDVEEMLAAFPAARRLGPDLMPFSREEDQRALREGLARAFD